MTDLQQYRKRVRHSGPQSTQPLSGSRLFDTGRLDFAVERDYGPEAQVMGMQMEGVDIAVSPATGSRVGFLEAQNSWVPGLLSRFEWDYPHFDSNFPAQILRGGAHLYGFTEADFAKADEAAAAKD